mmetsp:Transcript_62186/g.131376  ORF Transcript_62186/g.131376 Transcript_62186/m.131376 type:complete len:221 (-) Transcript_62186:1943-2605(-)
MVQAAKLTDWPLVVTASVSGHLLLSPLIRPPRLLPSRVVRRLHHPSPLHRDPLRSRRPSPANQSRRPRRHPLHRLPPPRHHLPPSRLPSHRHSHPPFRGVPDALLVCGPPRYGLPARAPGPAPPPARLSGERPSCGRLGPLDDAPAGPVRCRSAWLRGAARGGPPLPRGVPRSGSFRSSHYEERRSDEGRPSSRPRQMWKPRRRHSPPYTNPTNHERSHP